MPAEKTVIIIAGPTAVGKTGIAIEVAKRLDTAIISADSRQCYQGMCIGTAQPSEEQLQEVPHFFINEFPVTATLSAGDFERLSLGYLDQIFKEKDTAVVCGGTGLYIRALCGELDAMPPVDNAIFLRVNEDYKQQGLAWLQQYVQQEDPLFYAQADRDNPARLLRALIFKLSTGDSILRYQSQPAKTPPFRIIKIGLELPREVLYARINQRVADMLAAGLLEEVRALYPQRGLKNLQTVGYTELFDFIAGTITLDQAMEQIQQHTRNYAKRQLTWFRKDEAMRWFSATDAQVTKHITDLL